MPLPPEQAWFPRKRFGYGWSWPATWQGWLVLAGYLALFGFGATTLAPHGAPVVSAYLLALTAAFAAVCWWKGARSIWRG
ncbi:MAG TPA: hypothetical protein VHE13_07255 [Opitutus sp.]|nr:hypothetical protein [Opitutus sp.]